MADTATTIVNLSQGLVERQKRLAEIEAERIQLKNEIIGMTEQLAALVPPAFGSSNRTQVLWVLRNDPDHAYSPLDVCRKLGRRSYNDVNAVRLVLSRLSRSGKVTKISHGRYQFPRQA
ncbi:MAG TPA: hypothetical protein VH087_20660 [Thermoanaerobaculia bacterium]|jgi:hypothetical protein|nr:hypothetical protein [Thermoanaerobaculia bacterium]